MRHLHRVGPIPVALACLAVAPTLSAQIVHGTVVESGTRTPIGNAIVLLLDEHGAQLAATLTSDSGRFAFKAPAAGRYELRTERIGYRSLTTSAFSLGAGETVDRQIAASVVPITLSAITVTGKDAQCVIRPEQGADAALVWEEARKALEATRVAQDQRLFRVTTTLVERDLAPHSNTVLREQSRTQTGVSDNPFISIPAESLAALGYIRPDHDSVTYSAPDASVLLSETFAGQHCFRLVDGDEKHAGLIGLAFQPTRKRKLPDVKGTLWLDRKTAALRDLEFEYTALPAPVHVPSDLAGGRIDFLQLPTGAWIVDRWIIRMPVLAANPDFRLDAILDDQPRYIIARVHESGGEVRDTYTLDGRQLSEAQVASIDGTVFDSTRGAPLAGARVFLANTSYATTTDSAGHFVLTELPEGKYTLAIAHPIFDALGLGDPHLRISLERGTTMQTTIAVPSTATVLAALCPDSVRGPHAGLVVGTVRAMPADTPLAGAHVSAALHGRTVTNAMASTDSAGTYRVCGVPADQAVELRAFTPDTTLAGTAQLTVAAGAVVVRDIRTDTSTARVFRTPVRTLAAVKVKGRRNNDSDPTGFARRRHTMRGYFLTAADIQRRSPATLSDLLRTIPEVNLGSSGSSNGLGGGMQPTSGSPGLGGRPGTPNSKNPNQPGNSQNPPSSGGTPNAGQFAGDSTRSDAGPLSQSEQCVPGFFIDAVPVQSDGVPDGLVQPQDIAAIEIYPRLADVPVEFTGTRTQCGAVIIWTKQGMANGARQ